VLRRYFIPGRIELVGKHVDYAGGASLTCAIDRGLTVSVERLETPILRLESDSRRDRAELPLTSECAVPSEHWSTYAAAVIRRLQRDFPSVRQGLSVAIESTLPESAGLSSSSALVIAIATAIVDFNGLRSLPEWTARMPSPLAEAEYFAALETGAPYRDLPGDEGVGVAGGAQDPIAILCAQEGHCGLFGYLPAVSHRYVAWPEDYVLAIGVSGVEATKTGNARAAYNRTAQSVRAMVRAWNARSASAHPTLQAALLSSPDALAQLRQIARECVDGFEPDYLVGRLEQYLVESTRLVPGAVAALATRQLASFGDLIAESQRLAESGLRNQVPETVSLVQQAQANGAVAASAFGAGFGGAVWSMVPKESATLFLEHWARAYAQSSPARQAQSQFFLTSPSRGAHVLGND